MTRLRRTRSMRLLEDTGILLHPFTGSCLLCSCCVEGSEPPIGICCLVHDRLDSPCEGGGWQPKLPWSVHLLLPYPFLLDPLRVTFQLLRLLMLHFLWFSASPGVGVVSIPTWSFTAFQFVEQGMQFSVRCDELVCCVFEGHLFSR